MSAPGDAGVGRRVPILARRLAARVLRGIRHWSWFNLRIASAMQEVLRRRLTLAGQGLLAATFIAGLFGVDTRQTAAYQVFALGVALLSVAWLGRGRRLPGLAARRLLPRHASVGEPCRYRVLITNPGPKPLRGITVGERLPDPRPDAATFLSVTAPFESRLNPFERLFGYPRWDWLVRGRRRVAPPLSVPLPDLPPGETLALDLTLLPTHRGLLRLPLLVAARTDALGLTRRETGIDGPASDRLLILPRRWPVRPQSPPGRRRLQPGGVTLAGAVGDSREFIGLRDYLPGDSPRHIHWAAWARCGEPVVKEYQDEYFSRQALVLDTCVGGPDASGRAARLGAFECAVSVAASLVEPLTRQPGGQDGLLDLVFVAGTAHMVSAGRGVGGGDALLEVLAGLEPDTDDGLPALAEQVAGQAARLSACLCVLLDWDPPRQALCAALAAHGVPVRALVCVAGDGPLAPVPPGLTQAQLLRVDPADPAPALARL